MPSIEKHFPFDHYSSNSLGDDLFAFIETAYWAYMMRFFQCMALWAFHKTRTVSFNLHALVATGSRTFCSEPAFLAPPYLSAVMPFVFHCFASALNALEKFINFNSIRDWPGKVKGKVYPRHGAAPDKDGFFSMP